MKNHAGLGGYDDADRQVIGHGDTGIGSGVLRDINRRILETAAYENGPQIRVVHRGFDRVDDRVCPIGVEPVTHNATQTRILSEFVDRFAQGLHIVGIHQLHPVERGSSPGKTSVRSLADIDQCNSMLG